MKRIINIVLFTLGIAFISSCSSTGSIIRGSDAYGYSDNAYYYGYPNHYQSYPYYQRPVIRHDVIVIPEQRKVIRNRDNVRRRHAASPSAQESSPNTRRRVAPPSDGKVIKSNSPTRRSSAVAPSSRRYSTPAPATRTKSSNESRRGNN